MWGSPQKEAYTANPRGTFPWGFVFVKPKHYLCSTN
nr:MAG TPA: hypothetical protein [Caudoviricetes sp.]